MSIKPRKPRKKQASPASIERKAAIVAEGELLGTDVTCGKYGIADRTYRLYVSQIRDAPEHSELALTYQLKKRMLATGWAKEAKETLLTLFGELRRQVQQGDAKFYEVAGAVKIVSEAIITNDAISVDSESQTAQEIAARTIGETV